MFLSRTVTRLVLTLLAVGTACGTLPLSARACGCLFARTHAPDPAPRACCRADAGKSCCPVSAAGKGCCCSPDSDDSDCQTCACGEAAPAKAPVDQTAPPPPAEPMTAAGVVGAFPVPAAGPTTAARLADGRRAVPPSDLVISLSRLIC